MRPQSTWKLKTKHTQVFSNNYISHTENRNLFFCHSHITITYLVSVCFGLIDDKLTNSSSIHNKKKATEKLIYVLFYLTF